MPPPIGPKCSRQCHGHKKGTNTIMEGLSSLEQAWKKCSMGKRWSWSPHNHAITAWNGATSRHMPFAWSLLKVPCKVPCKVPLIDANDAPPRGIYTDVTLPYLNANEKYLVQDGAQLSQHLLCKNKRAEGLNHQEYCNSSRRMQAKNCVRDLIHHRQGVSQEHN